MIELISFLAIFFAVERINEMPVYKQQDFHYFNENGKAHALPVLPKIFVVFEDRNKFLKFTEKIFEIKMIEPYEEGAVIIHCRKQKHILGLLNKISLAGFRCAPIVIFDNIESIPGNTIILEPKSSVTDFLIVDRVSRNIKANSIHLRRFDKRICYLDFEGIKLPKNILAVANLISNDDFWFKWATPVFQPLYEPIIATAEVETRAITHLGELRKLKIKVDIYDNDIKLRKDLLPVIGQANFFPSPLFDNLWLDTENVEIEEFVSPYKKSYLISYPFKVLNFGAFVFQRFNLFYEVEGEVKPLEIDGISFFINSITRNSGIDDIQPIRDDLSLVSYTVTRPDATNFNWYKYLSFGSLLLSILGVGLLGWLFTSQIYFAVVAFICNVHAVLAAKGAFRYFRNKVYQVSRNKPENWREAYQDILRDSNLYEHHHLFKDEFKSELNKIYIKDAKPDFDKLRKLI